MNHGSTLQQYLQVLRRRKWIALLALIVVPAVAVALSMLQTVEYSASAEVLLSRQNLSGSLNGVVDPTYTVDPQRLVETQMNVAEAPQIAKAVVEAAKLDRTPGQFLASSSVSSKTGADVLDFHVNDHDAKLAAKLVSLYAAEYISYANQLATGAIRNARAEVLSKLAQLEASGNVSSALHNDLASKEQQLATMEALQTGNAVLLKGASGASQVQPRPVRNGLLGLALGLVLGLGLAFLRDHLDTRVRTAGEVSQRLGLPLLARLPAPPRELRRKNKLVMAEAPTSQDAEPFRVLAMNLEFVAHESAPKTIMVSSAREGEGKSTTAANLAVTLARAGRRVAIVDLDLRRPFLHELFQLPPEPGLTNLIVAHKTLEEVLVRVPLPRSLVPDLEEDARWQAQGELEVMCCGAIPPNPGEFVRSRDVGRVLSQLKEIFDVVIVDAAPLLGVGDSLALIPQMDAVIVVTRLELLRRPVLDELHRVLEGSPAKPLGIVVTAAEREGGEGYGYGYGYGYGHDAYGSSYKQSTNGRPVPSSIHADTRSRGDYG
jgi:succinoglycan biosynthesis transport protein ExoP